MLKRHHHTLGQNSAFEKKCFFWFGNHFFDEKTVKFGGKQQIKPTFDRSKFYKVVTIVFVDNMPLLKSFDVFGER